MQPKAAISNAVLQACLEAAADSYRVQPDIPSKFLHSHIPSTATSIFAFPGSHTMDDWVLNADFKQEPAAVLGSNLAGCQVHTGFARRVLHIMGSSSFEAELAEAVAAGNSIIFTGHSLGGAVATLATVVLLSRQHNGDVAPGLDISCCTFAAPIVGNGKLAALMESSGWAALFTHVVWRHDIVPRLLLSPGTLLPKAGTLMSDVAQKALLEKGLSAFLCLLARRQAADMPAAVPNGAAAAAAEEELTGEDRRALGQLTAGITAGCSQKAAAMVPPAVPVAPKGLLGFAGGIVQRAWEVPATVLGIRAAVTKLAAGGAANDKYRPFGTFVLHTGTGSLVCREPNEVLQMLYLTMVHQSTVVGTRPLDAVDEHFIGRYRAAVAAIVEADALAAPRWQGLDALIGDTQSLFELGLLSTARSLMQAQEEMMALIKNKLHQVPAWYEREEKWLEAQKAMDVIYKYRKSNQDAGLDYCDVFKAHETPADEAVEDARRVLRVFWDITIGMYSAGELPQRFLERGVWLTRARLYMELVEPVEIANYYRCKNWEKWAMGRRHYIEGKRPKRFEFIEAQFVAHYPGEALAPVLARARREADAVDFAELRMARAGAQPVPAAQELQQ